MAAFHPNNINNLLFNIPIYQRLFTWGDEQIKELLDDLLLEYLSSDSPSDYHIGVLTVRHDLSSNRLDLVDGQQRFTIMMLLGSVFKNMTDNPCECWNDFLYFNNDLRLDFCARPHDREYMKCLLDGVIESEYVNDTMRKGVLFIKKYINDFSSHCSILSNSLKFKKRVISKEDFCQYIYEHLSFFLTYLPKDYNARLLNKHFESMNSTGRNLENHEILKVQLLKKVPHEDYGVCVELWNRASRMEQTICPLSDPDEKQTHIETIIKARTTDIFSINKQENARKPDNSSIKALLDGKGEANIQIEDGLKDINASAFRSFLNFTDYLLQVLYLMLDANKRDNVVHQKFFNPNNLIKTCDRYIGIDEDKIKPIDYIKAIYRYRFFFDYYILRIDGKGLYRLLSSESSEHDKLEQYEAMLYADSSRYTYYRWIPFILNYVSDNTNALKNEKLLEKLKVYDSKEIDEHKKVDFEAFSFGNFNNYYFRRLDYYLWEFFIDKQGQAGVNDILPESVDKKGIDVKSIIDYKFHQYNSVEHFHPQSEKEQSIKWKDETSIHSFGNLALISNTFNSTQNDNSLEMKFARIEEQINQNKIESIKLVLMYFSAQQKATNWTKELMEKHKKLMVEFLENTYKI